MMGMHPGHTIREHPRTVPRQAFLQAVQMAARLQGHPTLGLSWTSPVSPVLSQPALPAWLLSQCLLMWGPPLQLLQAPCKHHLLLGAIADLRPPT